MPRVIVPAEEAHIALVGAFADQGPQQGRLPGPVQSDQGRNPVPYQVRVDPVEDGPTAEDDAEVSNRGERVVHRRTRASSSRFLRMVFSYSSAESSRSSQVSSGSTSANSADIGLSLRPRRESRIPRPAMWVVH